MNRQCTLSRMPITSLYGVVPDPRVSRYVTHVNKGKTHHGGLNGPRAMARRARQQCRIETREMRERLHQIHLAILRSACWGAGLTARNEERAGLLRAIVAIEARYA